MKKEIKSPYLPLILAIFVCVFPAADVVAQKAFKISGFSGSVTGAIYLARDYEPVAFSRLLVFTGVHNADINHLVIDEFRKIGIAAFNGAGFFPPVRDYTEEEFDTFCEERQIDGIIRTSIKDKWATSDGILTSEVELSLVDLHTDMTVATVFAYVRSASSDPDKGMSTFFRAVARELNLIVKTPGEPEN